MLVKDSMPYLMSAIQSFLKQKYRNKELIVVYSKSSDGSLEFLKENKFKNVKIYTYNKNLYSCLNYGVKKSSGKIVGILHSDDVFYDQYVLGSIVEVFKKKKIDIVYGDLKYAKRNELNKIKRIWNDIFLKEKYDLPPHTTTFIERKIYNRYLYNSKYKISSDTDFLLNIFKKKKKNIII